MNRVACDIGLCAKFYIVWLTKPKRYQIARLCRQMGRISLTGCGETCP